MLSIIVAHDQNRVIGYQEKLPWNLPQDLQRLKMLTMGKTIIMGRRTFESIGKALPGRENIVLTNQAQTSYEDVEIVSDIETIISKYADSPGEQFVFGGQSIFESLLPYTQKIYLTYIDSHFHGDRFFPIMNPSEWRLIEKQIGPKNEMTPFDYFYLTYERRN